MSVLRFFGATTVRAEVKRLLPPRSDDPEIAVYYEFLDFYKVTHVNYIRFSRLGAYPAMLKLLKGIFKGLLLLLLACLLLGGLALLAWWAGWPILSVLAVPVLLAAAVVLFWGLRRLWLWGKRRLYVKTVLTEDPSRRQTAEDRDSPLSRAWRRGMQVFSRSRVLGGSQLAGRNPWVILLGAEKGADWGAVHAG